MKRLNWLTDKHPLTIRKKLLLSFFTLIFLPLVILVAVSYISVTGTMEETIRYGAVRSFEQAYDMISYRINAMITASDVVYFNSDVQNVLKREKDQTDIVQQNKDMHTLEQLLNNLKDDNIVYQLSLYTPGWMMFSDQDVSFRNWDSLKEEPVYQRLIENRDMVMWLPPHDIVQKDNVARTVEVVSFMRKIQDIDRIGSVIGVMQVSTLQSTIEDVLTRANIIDGGTVFIQNTSGQIICTTDDAAVYPSIDENTRYDWQTVEVDHEPFLINSIQIANTDWYLIAAIPYKEIYAAGDRIRNIMLLLAFFLGFLAFSAAYIISSSITKRITMLRENMEYVQQGDLDVSLTVRGQDEIDKCMDSFNYMLAEIKQLMAEEEENGRILRRTELEVLQAQINPHFLYNMLELIHWKALDRDAPEISTLARDLANFYRTGLSKGRSVISLAKELEHVSTYVKIQNIRFDNRFAYSTDIEEEALQYDVLKMILQPLVENAIVHGILESDAPRGTVHLGAHLQHGKIVITVKDDGAGMSSEKIDLVMSGTDGCEQRGYGVKNIIQRINLCYGSEYGLSYVSEAGAGTTVTVTIPAWKEEDYIAMGNMYIS